MPDQEDAPTICHLKRYQHLARPGEEMPAVYLLEAGWACRYRVLRDGRRQISALFLPGDYCEPQWVLSRQVTSPVVALTACRAAEIPIIDGAGRQIIRPGRTTSILRGLLAMTNRQSDWMVSLGRRTAQERVCALFCDLFYRMRASGLALRDRFPMPLTQIDIADITGLTPVHVNRVLKVLREHDLLTFHSRWAFVANLAALREWAGEGD